MTAMLEVRKLAVRFGGTPGLDDLTFDVATGERLVILGASGAGKTTLLRALAGLAPTAAGSIGIAGRDVTREPAERRDAVYLHQTPLLFPHLSVFENVAFPLRIRRTPGGQVAATVEQLLHSVRLAGYGPRPPHTLSGGQRHRVALARAMAARPSLLLLDEPLASLDPPLRDEVRSTLFDLQVEYQPAVVIVTHDLNEAAALGHRIGIMLDKRLAQVASPEILFRHPASLSVARLLGIPNEVPGHLSDGRFDSALGVLRPAQPMLGGPVVAVFGVDALRENGAGVEGRIVALQHRPDRVLATVVVGGARVLYAPAPNAIPRIDDLLRLTLNPEQVSFFPIEPDA